MLECERHAIEVLHRFWEWSNCSNQFRWNRILIRTFPLYTDPHGKCMLNERHLWRWASLWVWQFRQRLFSCWTGTTQCVKSFYRWKLRAYCHYGRLISWQILLPRLYELPPSSWCMEARKSSVFARLLHTLWWWPFDMLAWWVWTLNMPCWRRRSWWRWLQWGILEMPRIYWERDGRRYRIGQTLTQMGFRCSTDSSWSLN